MACTLLLMVSRLLSKPALSVISPLEATIPEVAATVPTAKPLALENWKAPVLVPASVSITLAALSVTPPLPEMTFSPAAVMMPLASLPTTPVPDCSTTGPAGVALNVDVTAALSDTLFAAVRVIGLPPNASETMGCQTLRSPDAVVKLMELLLPEKLMPLVPLTVPTINAWAFEKSRLPEAMLAASVPIMFAPVRLTLPPAVTFRPLAVIAPVLEMVLPALSSRLLALKML